MRHIQKAAEPATFSLWRAGTSTDWAPSFGALSGDVKANLKHALLQEQGFVCCYCERRVAAGGDQDETCHIEHLVAQEAAPDRDLDYTNLLCSCTATRGAHCGMKKGRASITIHPLQADCTLTLVFRSDGSVDARAGDHEDDARRTIQTLGLNAPTLQQQRRQAIGYFLDVTRAMPVEQVRLIAGQLQNRDDDGRFLPMATAIQSLLGR